MNTTDTLIILMLSIMTNITLLGVMFYLTTVSIAKIRTSKKNLGLIALSLVIMYLVQKYDNEQIQIGAILSFAQYAVVVRLISGMPMKHVMTSILFSHLLQFLFQTPIMVIALLINPDFNFVTSIHGILAIICLSSLFTVLALRFLPVRRLYEKALQIPSFIIFTLSFSPFMALPVPFSTKYICRITLFCSLLSFFCCLCSFWLCFMPFSHKKGDRQSITIKPISRF